MRALPCCLAFLAVAEALVMSPALRATSSKVAASKFAAPTMSMETSALATFSESLAGVVAVDGGTIGLEVSFGAFLAVILGLFIPVVFLVTLYIQSEAQGTATTFRDPDSRGGKRYDAD
jgi:photosystem II PsbM protein